ncbi:hypothetical protein CBL_00021 [Carabus blaptoides fortunei]
MVRGAALPITGPHIMSPLGKSNKAKQRSKQAQGMQPSNGKITFKFDKAITTPYQMSRAITEHTHRERELSSRERRQSPWSITAITFANHATYSPRKRLPQACVAVLSRSASGSGDMRFATSPVPIHFLSTCRTAAPQQVTVVEQGISVSENKSFASSWL